MIEKFKSLFYYVQSKFYRSSSEWKNHPNNIDVLTSDWDIIENNVKNECNILGVEFKEHCVNKEEYAVFKNKYGYNNLSFYAFRCKEKKYMEHYLSFKMIDMTPGDTYMDVASENSPFPLLVSQIDGVKSYSQDLTYPPGIHGRRIGSSADKLPIPDNWLDKISLQCAFEHFQGNTDINFIRELARVLRFGGKCAIVPLYLGPEYLNIYDPILNNKWNKYMADPYAKIVAEISLGGHFERIYSPKMLNRIIIPDIGLKYILFKITEKEKCITNLREIEKVKRIRYGLLIEKVAK